MAAERRPGRKGSGWQGNRGREETMRLPNALFDGFLFLNARDELVCYMRPGFFVFASLLSLIPLLHQIFTELVSPLILWTFGTALTGKRTNLAALPAAMHLGRKFGSATTHCSQQSTGYRASRRKLFQLPEGDR